VKRIFAKRRLQYAAAAFLVFAALSAFGFSAPDVSFLDGSSECPLFLTAEDSRVDCLAINPAKDTVSARQSLLRVIMPQIPLTVRAGFVCGAVKALAKTIQKTIKNTILLKLRI
jgi:hypothetical protein